MTDQRTTDLILSRENAAVLGAILASQLALMKTLTYMEELPLAVRDQLIECAWRTEELSRKLLP